MMLFGALFGIFEPRDRQGLALTSPWFWHGVVFTSIFNVAVVYAIVHYPDWMWMYFTEHTRQDLPELIYIFVFVYYVPYAAGFYIARELNRKSSILWFLFTISMAGAEAWIVFRLFDRYSVIGTNAEFAAGTAVSLFGPQNPIALVMNGSVAAMVVYYIFSIWLSRRRRRHVLSI